MIKITAKDIRMMRRYASSFPKEFKNYRKSNPGLDENSSIYDFFMSEKSKEKDENSKFARNIEIITVEEEMENCSDFGKAVMLYRDTYSLDFNEFIRENGSVNEFVDIAKFYVYEKEDKKEDDLFINRFNSVCKKVLRHGYNKTISDPNLPIRYF